MSRELFELIAGFSIIPLCAIFACLPRRPSETVGLPGGLYTAFTLEGGGRIRVLVSFGKISFWWKGRRLRTVCDSDLNTLVRRLFLRCRSGVPVLARGEEGEFSLNWHFKQEDIYDGPEVIYYRQGEVETRFRPGARQLLLIMHQDSTPIRSGHP